MKRVLLLSAAALLLSSAAMAEKDKGKKPAARATVHCAVMTDSPVKVKDAMKTKMYADYKGNRYFFCCGGCPAAFKKDPAKYAKNDHIALPKKVKKPSHKKG